MKNVIFIFTTIAIILSCNKKPEDSGIIGEWRLIEVYMDPGDGSGSFEIVDSDKIINFKSDGSFNSNGDMCFTSIETNEESFGNYNMNDSTITPSSCEEMKMKITGDELIITYPCFEACQAKFKKY